MDQTCLSGHLWHRFVARLYEPNGQISGDTAPFYRVELFVPPLLVGLMVGLLSRSRPIRGILSALGLLAIPAIGVGGMFYGLAFTNLLWVNSWPEWVKTWLPNPIPAAAGIGFWAAIGCLAAWFGSRMQIAWKLHRDGRGSQTQERHFRSNIQTTA